MKPPVCRKNEGMCAVEVESILMRENQNHLYRRFNKISVSCRKEAVRGEVVLRKLEDHETPSSSSATLCKPRTSTARMDHIGEGLTLLCIKRENA